MKYNGKLTNRGYIKFVNDSGFSSMCYRCTVHNGECGNLARDGRCWLYNLHKDFRITLKAAESYMKYFVVEWCANCESENIIEWDVEKDGYEAYCSHCGAKLMLCDECLHAEDNKTAECKWNGDKCWRMKV